MSGTEGQPTGRISTAQEREQILRAFGRRRQLELLIAIPILGGVVTLILLYRNPGYQVAGFGGLGLGLVAAAILAAGVMLHFVNWRCPACGRLLHRGIAGAPFCRGCGQRVPPLEKTPMQPTAPERGLARELLLYRWQASRLLLAGVVLFGAGIALVFFFEPSPGPRGDLWLYRNFGERGLWWGARGTGALALLLAALLLVVAYRRLTVGVRARETSSRQVLRLPPASNVPARSQAGFLLAILVSIVALAAFYWLVGWGRGL